MRSAKKVIIGILLACSLLVGTVGNTFAAVPGTQSWTGWLIDADCVGANPKTHTQNCNLMPTCIDSGEGIYVYTAGKAFNTYDASSWIPFDASSQELARQLNLSLSDPSNHEKYLSKYSNRIPTIKVTGYKVASGFYPGITDYIGDYSEAIHITSIEFYYIDSVSNYQVTSPENVVLNETPTATPTPEPTAVPTATPTAVPTAVPTPEPTAVPTPEPTAVPTPEPTVVPTPEPTVVPTPEPTAVPTPEPTATAVPELNPDEIHVTAGVFKDITTSIGENTLYSIKNGDTAIIPEIDYTVSGNVVKINRWYLNYYFTKFPNQNLYLEFNFKSGNSKRLIVYTGDTPHVVLTEALSYDAGSGKDAELGLVFNGNFINSIKNNDELLKQKVDFTYSPSEKILYIRKAYLKNYFEKTTEPLKLTVYFTGDTKTVVITPVK